MKKRELDDWEEIKRIYDFMCREGLASLDLAEKEYKVRLKRRQKEKPILTPITPLPIKKEEKISLPTIKSPLTGIFYRAPSPKAQPFVEPGQVVEKGQILCIIEAMKVMNEILAENRCRIEKIYVENGHLVLAGQEIFAINLLEG